MNDMDTRLRQVSLLIDFYFAPWGAAKGEIWEALSNDREFTALNVGRWAHAILSGQANKLTSEQERMLKVVAD